MLEQMSHPSVQKYIHGSIVTGGGRRGGGGSNDSDKNKDGKTYEQIKRDKRQILIRCVVCFKSFVLSLPLKKYLWFKSYIFDIHV